MDKAYQSSVDWFKKPLAGQSLVYFLVGSAIVSFIATIMICALMASFGITVGRRGMGSLLITNDIIPRMVSYALIEETLCRFIPLFIAFATKKKYVILATVILSSITFGWVHGSWANIPVQGVAGLIFCCVFLKCSSFGRNLGKGLLCSTAVHAGFNLILVAILVHGGAKTL